MSQEITLAVHDDTAEKLERLERADSTARAQLRNQVEKMILDSYAQAVQQGAIED